MKNSVKLIKVMFKKGKENKVKVLFVEKKCYFNASLDVRLINRCKEII